MLATIMGISKQIKIVEVGPRDGLQNEKQMGSKKDKIHLINLLKKWSNMTVLL